MTKTEAENVAKITNLLRPDWPTKSIVTLIGRDHRHRPMRDVMLALVWIALDPDTKTPARVTEDGPWWKYAVAAQMPAEPRTPRPPTSTEECRQHPGWFATNCAGCRADTLARQEQA